jgi:hypothetical protein
MTVAIKRREAFETYQSSGALKSAKRIFRCGVWNANSEGNGLGWLDEGRRGGGIGASLEEHNAKYDDQAMDLPVRGLRTCPCCPLHGQLPPPNL